VCLCRIENNRFLNLGGNGVYLEGACIRNTFGGNEIAEVGACGVALAGAGAKYPTAAGTT
jgi:parallel beta-helix repeat protein